MRVLNRANTLTSRNRRRVDAVPAAGGQARGSLGTPIPPQGHGWTARGQARLAIVCRKHDALYRAPVYRFTTSFDGNWTGLGGGCPGHPPLPARMPFRPPTAIAAAHCDVRHSYVVSRDEQKKNCLVTSLA